MFIIMVNKKRLFWSWYISFRQAVVLIINEQFNSPLAGENDFTPCLLVERLADITMSCTVVLGLGFLRLYNLANIRENIPLGKKEILQ